jgi:hypothetical protein
MIFHFHNIKHPAAHDHTYQLFVCVQNREWGGVFKKKLIIGC